MAAARNKFRPCFETLESRLQPSGVTASALPTASRPALIVVTAPAQNLDALPSRTQLDALSPAQQQAQILQMSNRFRRSFRLGALRTNRVLQRIAQAHSVNQARQEKLEHVLNRRGPAERALAAGYRFSIIAENVAFNSVPDVNRTMRGWINSPGHRRNLLLRNVIETGIGAARSRAGNWYYTQVFASPLRFA